MWGLLVINQVMHVNFSLAALQSCSFVYVMIINLFVMCDTLYSSHLLHGENFFYRRIPFDFFLFYDGNPLVTYFCFTNKYALMRAKIMLDNYTL